MRQLERPSLGGRLALSAIGLLVLGTAAFVGGPGLVATDDLPEPSEVGHAPEESGPPAPIVLPDEVDHVVRDVVARDLTLPDGTAFEIVEVEPAFTGRSMTGGVAVVQLTPAFDGVLTLPGEQEYFDPDGRSVTLVNVHEYEVERLDYLLVAVEAENDRIRWAAPDPGRWVGMTPSGRDDHDPSSELPGEKIDPSSRPAVPAVRLVETRDLAGEPVDPFVLAVLERAPATSD